MKRSPISGGIAGDIRVVDYIPLDHAPAYIPGRPHRATPWRWATRGLTRHGQIIRLQTVMAGGRRYTTVAWIAEFLSRCNGEPSPTASPGQRQRQASAAMATLADMGVGSRSDQVTP